MHARLLFTIATVACLLGTYAVYAVVTRPFVVIPEIPEKLVDLAEHKMAHRPAENVRVAQTHLAELSWASESRYMMRSGERFIYTQEFEHTPGDNKIRFVPFAMVWLQKDKEGRESAVSLVSDSALVRFASGFDGSNPNPGRVVGAVLDGEVQMKGSDGLAIEGKQFVFDESAPSLISTNPVKFQYASHKGYGRNLNVKLIPAEGPPGRDRPHVYGVRTIRLGAGTNPVTKKWDPVQLDVRMPQQGQQKLIKVRCNGDLEYDVAAHTALFSQSVRAHSMTSASGYDALDCDKLWLQFTNAPGAAVEVTPPEDGKPLEKPPYQKLETDLAFSRLIAEGQTVKIVSTERNLSATMKRLVYDADQRRLQLTDPRAVYITQRGSTLAVPEVDVRMREDSWPEEVLCRGVGQMEMIRPESNELAFVASWAGELKLTRSSPAISGLDFIQLQQQASFRQPRQHTGLLAEVIQLWLATPIDNPADSGKPVAAPGEKSPDPQPKRLFAERNVALVSPQLIAKAGELDVRFEADTASQETSGVARESLQLVALEVPVTQSVAREPLRPQQQPQPKSKVVLRDRGVQPVNHSVVNRTRDSLGPPIDIPLTTGGAASNKSRPANPLARSQEPLEVVADRIAVQMRRIEGKTEPELVEVDTQGRVKIVQRRPNGEAPLTAEGDRLRLQNRGLQREIVHLFGQPAHLRDRGLHVEGREVHLDRAANRVWVKGNGLLQLPVPPGTQLETIGQTANDPDLDVWWEESMEFDGRTAKFIGKVRAELGLSRMRCEQMDVGLSSRLSFTETQREQQPELSTVHCKEDVTFDSSAYEGTIQVQIQRGKVAEFKIDHLKGTSSAQGPGWIQVLQRGKGEAPAQRDVMQANRPINSVSSEWTFTRIDFKGQMIGKIREQSSTFYDSVLIVHGPVERLTDKIDADHLPPLAGSMRCDELEFSHHSKGPNHPADYQQLVGKVNARIEGRGFYANASEISYDGAKGLYMLRSYGNQNATIAQEDNKGRRHEASGRRIEFIPATKTVKVDRATGASGSP
jgi:lipopolysaccharide export system protein LptA